MTSSRPLRGRERPWRAPPTRPIICSSRPRAWTGRGSCQKTHFSATASLTGTFGYAVASGPLESAPGTRVTGWSTTDRPVRPWSRADSTCFLPSRRHHGTLDYCSDLLACAHDPRCCAERPAFSTVLSRAWVSPPSPCPPIQDSRTGATTRASLPSSPPRILRLSR